MLPVTEGPPWPYAAPPMSDGAGGPIIEPGGRGHFHGGSDVGDSKKISSKVIMMDVGGACDAMQLFKFYDWVKSR